MVERLILNGLSDFGSNKPRDFTANCLLIPVSIGLAASIAWQIFNADAQLRSIP